MCYKRTDLSSSNSRKHIASFIGFGPALIQIDGRTKYLLVKTRDKNYVFKSKNLVKDLDELETGLNRNRDSPLEHESQEESHEEGVQNSRTPGDSAQFQTQIELQLYSQT